MTNQSLNFLLPEGCVIAAVIRGKEVFMHSKDLLLKPDDKIIVFILGKTDKEKIENLFLDRLMNYKSIFNLLGILLGIFSLSFVPPIVLSFCI